MSDVEFRDGDRVRVTYEGTYEYRDDDGEHSVHVDDIRSFWAPPAASVELIERKYRVGDTIDADDVKHLPVNSVVVQGSRPRILTPDGELQAWDSVPPFLPRGQYTVIYIPGE